MIKKTILLLTFILLTITVFAEEKFKWQKFSGKWEISDSKLFERNGSAAPWNFYELLNINSIISFDPYKEYSSVDFSMELLDRIESPAEASFSFNVTSEDKQWYYHIYSFKFSGGFWGINKVSLIHSDRKDKSKPFNEKNNIFINEIKSSDIKLKYKKTYNCHIEFNGKDVTLYIDGNKALTSTLPSENHGGRIAFSTKNVKIAIDKVSVKLGEKVIFEDDFNENTIYIKKLKASKERTPAAESEKVNAKKP